MVSFAEASPSSPSHDKVFCRHWRKGYAGALEKRVEFIACGHASATFDNDGRLQRICHRHAAFGSRCDRLLEFRRIGLSIENREQGRAIDNQWGKPRWS